MGRIGPKWTERIEVDCIRLNGPMNRTLVDIMDCIGPNGPIRTVWTK